MAVIETVSYKKRGEVLPLEKDDMTAVLTLVRHSLAEHRGAAAKYENTAEGLERFKDKTMEYLQCIDDVNRGLEAGKHMVPDLESWALYCGICRKTLFNYESRGGEWRMFVRQVKDGLTAIKKQLAFRGKLPPVVLFFDLTNNSDYVNASEFKISKPEPEEKKVIRLEDIDSLEIPELYDKKTSPADIPDYD